MRGRSNIWKQRAWRSITTLLAVTLVVGGPAAPAQAEHGGPHVSYYPDDTSATGWIESYISWCQTKIAQTDPASCATSLDAIASELAQQNVREAGEIAEYGLLMGLTLANGGLIVETVGSIVGFVEDTTGVEVPVDAAAHDTTLVVDAAGTEVAVDPNDAVGHASCAVANVTAPQECVPVSAASQGGNGAGGSGWNYVDYADLSASDPDKDIDAWVSYVLYKERPSHKANRPTHTQEFDYWALSQDGAVSGHTVLGMEGEMRAADDSIALSGARPKVLEDYGSNGSTSISVSVYGLSIGRTWNITKGKAGGITSRSDGFHKTVTHCNCWKNWGFTTRAIDGVNIWKAPTRGTAQWVVSAGYFHHN